MPLFAQHKPSPMQTRRCVHGQALWLHDPLGEHVDTMMDVVALLGLALSVLSAIFWFASCAPLHESERECESSKR